MLRRGGPLCRLCLIFLLALALGGAAAKKDSMFSRFSRALKETATAATDILSSVTTAATAATKTTPAATPAVTATTTAATTAASAPGAASGLVDMWEADPMLKMATRVLKGDHVGVLGDMVDSKDLDGLWQDPDTLKTIFKSMPMLKSIRGMEDIANKKTLTADDGTKALGLFRKMMKAMPEKMTEVMTPTKFADKMQSYANTNDPTLKSLYSKVEKGDFNAYKQLHQLVADKEWNNLVDMDKFGLNGQEPEQLKMMREGVMKDEPDLFRLMHMDDPLIKMHLEDPTIAYKEALKAGGLSK